MANEIGHSILAMSTLAERLRERITELGVTQADLARATGAKEPSVTKWLNGQTKNLKGKNLVKAAEFLRVSEAWLADGVGPKERTKPGQPFDSPAAESHTGFTLLDKHPDIVTISRYETGGSMGDGVVLHDQPGIIESWRVSKQWLAENVRGYTSAANLAIVTGFGDSMRPTYNPGDPLIVDRGITTVPYDSIYFFRIGEEGFVKRLQRVPTENGLIYQAISDNPAYPSFPITPGMDFAVLARVVQVWRREDY